MYIFCTVAFCVIVWKKTKEKKKAIMTVKYNMKIKKKNEKEAN